MRIGVDATCWQNTRGFGRYARALLSALVRLDAGHRYLFFMDSTENTATLPPGIDVRMVRTSRPTSLAASSSGHRAFGDMWRMSRAMSDPSLDLLFFPTVYTYVPVLSRAKRVVMIHDVIATEHPRLTLPSRRARLFWRAKEALGRWQADAIATLSDYSRDTVSRRLRLTRERLHVIGAASDPVFRVLDDPRPTARLGALGLDGPRRSVVYVGGFSPHKNLELLVSVFGRLIPREEFGDVRLVMVGAYEGEVFHSYFETIRRQVEQLPAADRVIFTGFLPDEDLVVLLNRATVLVLPSLVEGFGLPAIEAAACGCPVIATSRSPLPGLLGEGGLYVDPNRAAELEQALCRVLASPGLRREMREAGLAAARRLTWDAVARQMLALLEKTVAP